VAQRDLSPGLPLIQNYGTLQTRLGKKRGEKLARTLDKGDR
jgi:hypothetical protein